MCDIELNHQLDMYRRSLGSFTPVIGDLTPGYESDERDRGAGGERAGPASEQPRAGAAEHHDGADRRLHGVAVEAGAEPVGDGAASESNEGFVAHGSGPFADDPTIAD